jgi:ankyrin repeat protein
MNWLIENGLRKYIRLFIYLVVFNCIFPANSGSYEDFFKAIKTDDATVVRELLERGFDPNVPDPNGQNGLFLAIREPSLKVANVLIDWPKTLVESRNKADESPLMMAALKGHTAIVKKLIGRDADVNKPGWSPLHYAATYGHLEIMTLLLDNHAYIDASSPNESTPLMMAALYGTPSAVKLLLEAGADPSIKNSLGMTAIDFAHRDKRMEAAEIIAAFVRGRQGKGTW